MPDPDCGSDPMTQRSRVAHSRQVSRRLGCCRDPPGTLIRPDARWRPYRCGLVCSYGPTALVGPPLLLAVTSEGPKCNSRRNLVSGQKRRLNHALCDASRISAAPMADKGSTSWHADDRRLHSRRLKCVFGHQQMHLAVQVMATASCARYALFQLFPDEPIATSTRTDSGKDDCVSVADHPAKLDTP